MPRQSPFVIWLTEEERAELEELTDLGVQLLDLPRRLLRGLAPASASNAHAGSSCNCFFQA
jgi:hypothetical protein